GAAGGAGGLGGLGGNALPRRGPGPPLYHVLPGRGGGLGQAPPDPAPARGGTAGGLPGGGRDVGGGLRHGEGRRHALGDVADAAGGEDEADNALRVGEGVVEGVGAAHRVAGDVEAVETHGVGEALDELDVVERAHAGPVLLAVVSEA